MVCEYHAFVAIYTGSDETVGQPKQHPMPPSPSRSSCAHVPAGFGLQRQLASQTHHLTYGPGQHPALPLKHQFPVESPWKSQETLGAEPLSTDTSMHQRLADSHQSTQMVYPSLSEHTRVLQCARTLAQIVCSRRLAPQRIGGISGPLAGETPVLLLSSWDQQILPDRIQCVQGIPLVSA